MAAVYRAVRGEGEYSRVERVGPGGVEPVAADLLPAEAETLAEQLQDAYDLGRYDEATERAEANLRQMTEQLKIDRARAEYHRGQGRPELADLLARLVNDKPAD